MCLKSRLVILNNSVKEIYKELEEKFGTIEIPEEEFEKSKNRINSEMEKYAREFRYKCAKSEEEASRHFLTF